MKTLKLDFQEGVSRSMDNDKSVNGIYIAYAGEETSTGIKIKKIIYIGMSIDLSNRANDNRREDDQKKWQEQCATNEQLWYKKAYVKTEDGSAGTVEDVRRVENALIYKYQPKCNIQGKKGMNYPDTKIKCTGGIHKLIDSEFEVLQSK